MFSSTNQPAVGRICGSRDQNSNLFTYCRIWPKGSSHVANATAMQKTFENCLACFEGIWYFAEFDFKRFE